MRTRMVWRSFLAIRLMVSEFPSVLLRMLFLIWQVYGYKPRPKCREWGLPRPWLEGFHQVDQIATAANGKLRKVVNVGSILSLFVRISDFHVRTWFGIVKNLTVDVFHRTSFIYWCICGTLKSKWKVVFCHLGPVDIIATKTAINAIYVDNNV